MTGNLEAGLSSNWLGQPAFYGNQTWRPFVSSKTSMFPDEQVGVCWRRDYVSITACQSLIQLLWPRVHLQGCSWHWYSQSTGHHPLDNCSRRISGRKFIEKDLSVSHGVIFLLFTDRFAFDIVLALTPTTAPHGDSLSSICRWLTQSCTSGPETYKQMSQMLF